MASIKTDRLVIFCGAGISMAQPSRVPSGAELAQNCSRQYNLITGAAVSGDARQDLERLAAFFFQNTTTFSLFIEHLIPWHRFRRDPNRGHSAVADFLACGVIDFAVTTNLDALVEVAAEQLGEHDFLAALDGEEANRARPHQPYLKMHGCGIRDRDNTLWTSAQLDTEPINSRIETAANWLRGHLIQRDVLVIGFWSDWGYLNEVLVNCVSESRPSMVVLVDPEERDRLEEKAPQLWAWAHHEGVEFQHVQESGNEFLEDLRHRFSRQMLLTCFENSRDRYVVLTGETCDQLLALDPTISTEDLYALRKDFSGVPSTNIVRKKTHDAGMLLIGAIHILLMSRGAQLDGSVYIFAEMRIRLINGNGDLISYVQNEFRSEPALQPPVHIVICINAQEDGGVPSDVIRGKTESSIVRPTSESEWHTLESARELLGI